MNLYTIATESKATGQIVALNIAPMAMRQAEAKAKELRKLAPAGTPVYVINVNALN